LSGREREASLVREKKGFKGFCSIPEGGRGKQGVGAGYGVSVRTDKGKRTGSDGKDSFTF
jgi:hypothetical protein